MGGGYPTVEYKDGEPVDKRSPEVRIADALRRELGVHVDPQALRIFIRTQWRLLSPAAHMIHDA